MRPSSRFACLHDGSETTADYHRSMYGETGRPQGHRIAVAASRTPTAGLRAGRRLCHVLGRDRQRAAPPGACRSMEITSAGSGRFARNVMHFARALRAAGLPVGPGRVIEALRAVEAVGFASRQDLYWTLHSVFVNRRDQRELFDQCFHIFWRDPQLLERMMHLLLPTLEGEKPPEGQEEVSRRVAEALNPREPGTGEGGQEEEPPELELDAVLTWSSRELLQGKDFEQMSAEELATARREIGRLRLPIMQVATRRFRPEAHGRRVDLRRTLRQSLRGGGGGDRHRPAGAPQAASAPGHPVRHLGLDEPLLAHAAAVHARDHQRPRPGALLPVRHAAHQRHPPAAQPRHRPGPGADRRAGPGLGRRDADRRLPEGVQPGLVAPGAGPGCGGAPDQRRAGPRRGRRVWRSRWSGCTRAAGG